MNIAKYSEREERNSITNWKYGSSLTVFYKDEGVIDKIISSNSDKLEKLDAWVPNIQLSTFIDEELYVEIDDNDDGKIVSSNGFMCKCIIEQPEPFAFSNIDSAEKAHEAFKGFIKLLSDSFLEEMWIIDLYNEIKNVEFSKCTAQFEYTIDEPAEYWSKDKIIEEDLHPGLDICDDAWELFYTRIPESEGLMRVYKSSVDEYSCNTDYFSSLREQEKECMLWDLFFYSQDNGTDFNIDEYWRKPTSKVRNVYKQIKGYDFIYSKDEENRIYEMMENRGRCQRVCH